MISDIWVGNHGGMALQDGRGGEGCGELTVMLISSIISSVVHELYLDDAPTSCGRTAMQLLGCLWDESCSCCSNETLAAALHCDLSLMVRRSARATIAGVRLRRYRQQHDLRQVSNRVNVPVRLTSVQLFDSRALGAVQYVSCLIGL